MAGLSACSASMAQTGRAEIASPDKLVTFVLSIRQNQLYYQVNYKNDPVITPSAMGLSVDGTPVGPCTSLEVAGRKVIDETYPWRGLHSMAVNHCNAVGIKVKGVGASPSFVVEVRVFNNGAAFRYVVSRKDSSTVNTDNTVFTLPAGSTIWSQPDIGNYEGRYQRQLIDTVRQGQPVGPPLTILLPGHTGYAAITEGGLTDFAGMSLESSGNNAFAAHLTGTTGVWGPVKSPWRIVEVGQDLNTLVNCDIIANVSPAPDKTLFPQGFATDWVKPGKSVWSWLAGNGDVTLENMKRFSDWAGQLGFAYNLVDEGWSRWKDGDKDKWALLKELVDYSAARHVRVWVWKAFPDRNGVPGLRDSAARWDFFNRCKQAGVAGIKIDFFDAESQEVIAFYQAALRDAARLHLMLDFHGADKPTGQSRTWPNEVSREGIRGLENSNDWPTHNTTLPFTRFLAGHGDYTPLTFRDEITKGTTTLAHQVATTEVFTSPFMCIAADPEVLLRSPVREMVVGMPTDWDQTIVLPQSSIGEQVLYARRSGSTWYLGALNGEGARQVKVNLSFLGQGSYGATIMEDDPGHGAQVRIRQEKLDRQSTVTIDLMSGGGFVAKMVKQ